ncbi:MAG TPA: hypothetical protein VLM36_09010 [Sphingomicrobium sp.]|nr:hypothetical protein [Sphingomicrobium sp.]
MIRGKEAGRRYLAGFVLVGAVVHVATMGLEALFIWKSGDHERASSLFLTLGLAPSLAAGFFGWRAWLARSDRSAGLAAAGLLFLVAAAMLAHVSFNPGPR